MSNNKKICHIKIKPSDTLFFKDGQPFEEGLNNHLESLLMPNPSTLYGALTSCFLRQGIFGGVLDEIKNSSKNINEKLEEIFKIQGIYIYDEIENEVYVKAPLDLFKNDFGLKLGTYKNGCLYSPEDEFSKYEKVDNKFISLSDLLYKYADEKVKNIKLYDESYFFSKYKKVGIKINKKTNTAEDKHLYRLNMVEFNDNRFSYLLRCEFDSKLKIKNDVIKLGGEGKLAGFKHAYKIGAVEKLYEFHKKCTFNEKVKILLTSPLIIKDSDLGESVECAVTGNPKFIGGFDMANNGQKEIQWAIPEGSILIMKDINFKDKNFKDIYENIQKELNPIDTFKGFGNMIIIPFKNKQEN